MKFILVIDETSSDAFKEGVKKQVAKILSDVVERIYEYEPDSYYKIRDTDGNVVGHIDFEGDI